ncbi:MAG: tripartite tricarboxylate transporter substrate-binding protein [Xanthobacteraceae bacterium]|jgi:tripartite-type tricarboxylate transporter receptor subunit TctC
MTLYKHPTYSFKGDLAAVVLVADQPTILVARKDLPVDGLKDFIGYVKRNENTIKMGSAGVGATGYVDCAIFNGMIGVNIQAIPYRGQRPRDAGPDRRPGRPASSTVGIPGAASNRVFDMAA